MTEIYHDDFGGDWPIEFNDTKPTSEDAAPVNASEPSPLHAFRPGDIIHGFAGGVFGRDSYACRRVEAVGPDWVVTRNHEGVVELAENFGLPSRESANDRSYCFADCSGPELGALNTGS